jgi:hypothetical protein
MNQSLKELAKEESLAVVGGVGRMTQIDGVGEEDGEGLTRLGRLGWQTTGIVPFRRDRNVGLWPGCAGGE